MERKTVMKKTLSMLLVMLVLSTSMIGCLSKTASDKLNGTWKQKSPGTETMVLNFSKKQGTFISGTGTVNSVAFIVSSETKNEVNLVFSGNDKSMYAKFVLSDEEGRGVIATISNVDYYYTKDSESTTTGK